MPQPRQSKGTTNLILEDLMIRLDESIKEQQKVNSEIRDRLTSIEIEISGVKKAVGFFMRVLQICSWIAGIGTAIWKFTSVFMTKGGTE